MYFVCCWGVLSTGLPPYNPFHLDNQLSTTATNPFNHDNKAMFILCRGQGSDRGDGDECHRWEDFTRAGCLVVQTSTSPRAGLVECACFSSDSILKCKFSRSRECTFHGGITILYLPTITAVHVYSAHARLLLSHHGLTTLQSGLNSTLQCSASTSALHSSTWGPHSVVGDHNGTVSFV